MYMYWQKRQYMTPWDENELFIHAMHSLWPECSSTIATNPFISFKKNPAFKWKRNKIIIYLMPDDSPDMVHSSRPLGTKH